jgi:hypothetical protein
VVSAHHPNAVGSYLDPATDFPAAAVDLYPAKFRYPKGYFPSPRRVIDPEVLRTFDPWLRPYVKHDGQGACVVDESADGVRKLLHPSDGSVNDALRYLQWDGPPDASLQAAFACEDQTELAETFSKVGHHGAAIDTVLALPIPYQQASEARRVLLRSHLALGQFEPALENARALIRADDITDYARDLYRLEEAHLLLLSTRRSEAEPLLDRGRRAFRNFYLYYGLRAALAWMDGEETLAHSLIIRAGRVEPYHSPKLLWSPLLRPLYGFIRQELLGVDNGPLVYRRDKDVRRLCHRVQGALLTGRSDRAHNLAEGMIAHDTLQWETGEEFALCLAGLGEFVRLRGAAGMLPGWGGKNLRLASALAGAVLEPGTSAASKVRELSSKGQCSSGVSAHLESLMPFFLTGEVPPQFTLAERMLGSVSDRWSEQGRQHFLLLEREGRFEAQGIWQRTRNPFPCSAGGDLRGDGETNGLTRFGSVDEFHRWLEEKLAENVAGGTVSWPPPRWEIYLSGFGLLPQTPTVTTDAPLFSRVLEHLLDDPSLYFSHGPIPQCYGFRSSFTDRLIQMMTIFLATNRPETTA